MSQQSNDESYNLSLLIIAFIGPTVDSVVDTMLLLLLLLSDTTSYVSILLVTLVEMSSLYSFDTAHCVITMIWK